MDALATENVWWKISISIYYKTGPVNIPMEKNNSIVAVKSYEIPIFNGEIPIFNGEILAFDAWIHIFGAFSGWNPMGGFRWWRPDESQERIYRETPAGQLSCELWWSDGHVRRKMGCIFTMMWPEVTRSDQRDDFQVSLTMGILKIERYWKGKRLNSAAWKMHYHTSNKSSIRCASFRFHELQKLQIFNRCRRKTRPKWKKCVQILSNVWRWVKYIGFASLGSEDLFAVLDARISTQPNISKYIIIRIFMIYSWYINITCSAYIHHTVVIYSYIYIYIHQFIIHHISMWYPFYISIYIYIYIYTYISTIYIYIFILLLYQKITYINIYIHRISILPPPLFQKMSRCPRDLWSRSGTLSLGRHVTRWGAHAAPGITW